MSFSGFVVTDKGAALLAKAQTGTKITFTKAQIGREYVPEDIVITQTTNLYDSSPIVVPISGLSTSNKQSTISIQISNSTFTNEFEFREIGVFATDPTEGEILYMYGNAGDDADVIPSKAVPQEFLFNLITKVNNATDIEFLVDNSIIYATKADIAAMEGQLKNATVIEEISDSSYIPVVNSADDGKTKKISWAKIKQLLGGIMTFASQSQAETGTNNETVMTPLRVFQAISKWITTQTISTLNTTSKTLPGATNELKAGKADTLYYNNGQLQLRSGQTNIGLPVSIATGGTINAFVSGHNNFSVTLENATNTFTIPSNMNYDTSKIVYLYHNDVPLIRGKHYSISSVGVVTLAFTAEAGDVFNGEIEHTGYKADDLNGVLSVEKGGTGANTVEGALANLGIDGCAQIAINSYDGDGKYGENNPITLTFDFEPKFVKVWCLDNVNRGNGVTTDVLNAFLSNETSFIKPCGVSTYVVVPNNNSTYYQGVVGHVVTWGEKSISWFAKELYVDDNPKFNRWAAAQLNEDGKTYYYYAIG